MKVMRVWCGPMCAAKTTGALHVARRYARHKQKVILLRPSNSRRSHEQNGVMLTTKNGEDFPCFDHSSAEDLMIYRGRSDVIWIDEPNLFEDEEQLVEVVPALRKDSIILVSGLGATSELTPFGISMGYLLATADHVDWRAADCDVCNTHGTATRSLYIGDAPKGTRVVGGEESYRPACPDCWNSLIELPTESRRTAIGL